MLSNALTKPFVLGAFLALLATSAPALEVTLDEVTSEGTAGGERVLRRASSDPQCLCRTG